MDGRRGKVVCHLHIGGDLKKEMKYNNNFSTEFGKGWLGYRSTSKLVGITYSVPTATEM